MATRATILPVVSVRARLVSAMALLAALAMLGAGVTAYVIERTRILEQVDGSLDEAVASIHALAASNPSGWTSRRELLEASLQRIAPDDNTGALGVIDGHAALAPPVPMHVDVAAIDGIAERVSAETADGATVMGTIVDGDVVFRYVAVPISLAGQSAGTNDTVFVIGYDLNAELAELDAAASSFLIAGGVGLVVVIVLGWLLAGRLLAPIRALRQLAERITASGRSERIPVRGRDDVSQLTETVNAMLDRLDGAAVAQRRLLDDVGHELKTPVTIVRGHLELMDLDDPGDVREVRDVAVAELDRMAGLVADISRAAQLQGEGAFTMAPCDTADLLVQVHTRAQGIGGAEVTLGALAPVIVVADGERLTQALLQLVQNAVTHGAPPVELSSREDAQQVLLSVRDHGPGIPEDQRSAVFERFRRVGTGRGAEGSGLGLAIVRRIAEAHGGAAWVESADGGGARFVIAVPKSPPRSDEGVS